MRLIRAKDYQDASRKVANIISAQVILKPDCVLGLATGSSPVGAYQQMIKWCDKGDVDFSQTKTVNLDEYVGLAADHDQSYAYFMRKNFFDGINIDQKNTNLPNGLELDAAKECARYDKVIADLGGVDLQLLGIGANGHIGFNEPAEQFSVGTNRVDLTASTIAANSRFFENESMVPRQAYTMGMMAIMQAKRIVMIATGANKAQAVYDAFCGPVTPQMPASILQLHPDFVLVADEEALSLVGDKL
ncbi:MAG: glucosamine-6-phosphate deaminase [Ruminococcaceae bacterium]|nr:glucosamine-6-phosphate deaminase [Oscillospiraceae bacterium]